jgi:RNA-directed DNA polymerase
MHQSIREQGQWLKQVLGGYFRYHAVPTNIHALKHFREEVVDRWKRLLGRRSQKGNRTWAGTAMLGEYWLPQPSILHPRPEQRFAVMHSR